MDYNELLKEIHNETIYFFENILTSEKLQLKYGILLHSNRDFILNTIKEFKESRHAFIVKPFYEKDFSSSNRSIIIKRNDYGFITSKINIPNNEETIIEPLRFVSIIAQLIEDESIKKETEKDKNKETEKDNEISL